MYVVSLGFQERAHNSPLFCPTDFSTVFAQSNSMIPFSGINGPDGHFLKKRFYLFLERGEEKEKETDRDISVWLPLLCPLLETWPATQACALAGN